MKINKKIYFTFLFIAIFVFILSTYKGKKLSNEFDENQIKEKAVDVLNMVNQIDIKGIKNICNNEMKKSMTDEALNQIFDIVKQSGEYEEISKIYVMGIEDKSSNKPFGAAVLEVKYTNRDLLFTISFDTDMKLAGLHMK